jgi:DNA polymerase
MSRHEPNPETSAALAAIYMQYRETREFEDLQDPFVPGEGSYCPEAIFVGEAPGKKEAAEGHPFVGVSGNRLNAEFDEAGLKRRKMWITNAVKYWPREPGGNITRAPEEYEIEASRPYLFRELAVVAHSLDRGPGTEMAPLLVTLGRSAFTAVTGDLFRSFSLAKIHGQMMAGVKLGVSTRRWTVLPVYHPSALRSDALREAFREDFAKIAAEIKGRKDAGFYRRTEV